MNRLFVYGTLRQGGPANCLLKNSKLIKSNIRLTGYSMYNAGLYPIAVSDNSSNSILGDIYEVDNNTLSDLDKFEGDEYVRKQDQPFNCIIYVSKEETDLREVASGDWLAYAKDHGIVFPTIYL